MMISRNFESSSFMVYPYGSVSVATQCGVHVAQQLWSASEKIWREKLSKSRINIKLFSLVNALILWGKPL